MQKLSMKIGGEKVDFSNTVTINNVCAEVVSDAAREDVWQWGLFLSNKGNDKSPIIKDVLSADIQLDFDESAVYSGLTGDSCGEKSFSPIRKVLKNHSHLHFEPEEGKSSNGGGFPFFDIQTAGKVYCFAIGWSGQWSLDVFVKHGQLTVQIGMCDCSFYLNPGEKVRLPSVLMTESNGSADDARRSFRRLLRNDYSPVKRFGNDLKLPSALSSFDRYFKKNEEWLTEKGQCFCIDEAEKLGLDTHWIDACWFKEGYAGGTGNYTCDKGFPNGLRPVNDYAHSKGLKTVLWFEPERAHNDTETFLQHPEFFLPKMSHDNFAVFNLGDEKALEWLINKYISLIDEFNPDIYRQDCGCHPLEVWRDFDKKNRRGITEMKYIDGMYRLWDALTERFPNLLIDNCSGGGRRIDFESCKRSVVLWRSDTGCSRACDEKPTDTWNQNQTLALSRYIPFHATGSWTVKPYEVRSAMTDGIVFNLDVYGVEEGLDAENAKEVIAEQMRLAEYYKGDFYPLSEISLSEEIWAVWLLSLENKGCAVLFRRRKCTDDSFTFSIPNVVKSAKYTIRVTDENMKTTVYTMKGSELEHFSVNISNPGQSAVVEYSCNTENGD